MVAYSSMLLLLSLICFAHGLALHEKETTREMKKMDLLLAGPSTHPDHPDHVEILNDEDVADRSNEEDINQATGIAEYLNGGDMMMTQKQENEVITGKNRQGNAITNTRQFWSKAADGSPTVYYERDASFQDTNGILDAAIKEFTEYTCIKWVPRTNQRAYVTFFHGSGCYSSVGMTGRGQKISLQANNARGYGCMHVGVAVHEMIHAIGMFHEQSRVDRDQYVTINKANIVAGLAYNFDIMKNTVAPVEYDYDSIMHYGKTAFSRERGLITIEVKKQGITIGQRSGMSTLNKKGINIMYNCESAPTVAPVATTVAPVNPNPNPGPVANTIAVKIDDPILCPAFFNANLCSTLCLIRTICPGECVNNAENKDGRCTGWAESSRKYCVQTKYVGYMWRNCKAACLKQHPC